jgi:hypothetical protein
MKNPTSISFDQLRIDLKSSPILADKDQTMIGLAVVVASFLCGVAAQATTPLAPAEHAALMSIYDDLG